MSGIHGVMSISRDEDPVKVRECLRKKPYPTPYMAIKAIEQAKLQEPGEYNHFRCRHGDHYHIGKNRKAEADMAHKYFVEFGGAFLAKFRIQNEQWIFACPKGTPEVEEEIFANGVLVAHRNGAEFFRDKGGGKSRHWQLFKDIVPIYPRDALLARTKIVEAETMGFDLALNHVRTKGYQSGLAVSPPEKEPKRIILRSEDVKKIEEQEMYKGRAVFRTTDGRPFHRDMVVCSTEGCGNNIELRAFISTDADGKLANIYGKAPLDGKAERIGGNRSQKWICKDCAKKHKLGTNVHTARPGLVVEEAVEIEALPVKQSEALQPQPYVASYNILLDLQRIALDATVDADFVRGATVMACTILTGGGR